MQLTPESYVEFERKAEILEAGLKAAEKYDIPHHINRAGSMIGILLYK